jgi:hypothetical protein
VDTDLGVERTQFPSVGVLSEFSRSMRGSSVLCQFET